MYTLLRTGCGWGISKSYPVGEKDWVSAGWNKLPEEDSWWGKNRTERNIINHHELHLTPSLEDPLLISYSANPHLLLRNCASSRNRSRPSRCTLTWTFPNQTWLLLSETSGSSMRPWLLPTCRRRRSGIDPRSGDAEAPEKHPNYIGCKFMYDRGRHTNRLFAFVCSLLTWQIRPIGMQKPCVRPNRRPMNTGVRSRCWTAILSLSVVQ